MRNSTEDTDDDEGNNGRAENCLQEDSVLNLAQSWLLDPDLAIEDLADDVPLLVLSDPRLVLVAIARCMRRETVIRVVLDVNASFWFVIGYEQLPGTQMTMVHAVENDAHSLPGSDQCGYSDHETDEG